MAEALGHVDGAPTFFANIVTSNLNPDDITLEFRRVDKPHADTARSQAVGTPLVLVSGPTAEEIFATPPVARVVLTFSAVKSLKEYLDIAVPKAEHARKTGTNVVA